MDQRNLILAIALSLVILLGFQYLFVAPQLEQEQAQQQIQQVWQQAEQQIAKVEGDFLGQVDTWERAYTVCLEGRDYKVN